MIVGQSALAGLIGIAGGYYHTLGLKSDSSIVAWSRNISGQCDIPSPNADFVEIYAAYYTCVGRKSDGTVVVWGDNYSGQHDIPSPNSGFTKISGTRKCVVAIRNTSITAVAFSSIAAECIEGAVLLCWEPAADEVLKGYRIYRAAGSGDFTCITEQFLPPDIRSYEDTDIDPVTEYRYIVSALTLDGREIHSLEVAARIGAPPMALEQNVPNPFNPSTTISFSLEAAGRITLDIYDIGGRHVRNLADGTVRAGGHQFQWDGRDDAGRTVASGVYFYRLAAGKRSFAKKMILLK